jgi:hypothetical protein
MEESSLEEEIKSSMFEINQIFFAFFIKKFFFFFSRMIKRPFTPTHEEVSQNLEEWKRRKDDLEFKIDMAQGYIENEARFEERRNIAGESVQACVKRSEKESEWIFEQSHYGNKHINDVSCIHKECWYIGNLHRINEYKASHHLRGTDDVYLCDVCFDDRHKDYVRVFIEQHYRVDEGEEDLYKKNPPRSGNEKNKKEKEDNNDS